MGQLISGRKMINEDFFLEDKVEVLARKMIGMRLVTRKEGVLTSGIISETEAYGGRTDKASHAYGGRYTRRTEIMYKPGGHIYIYLCYGIHSLFNIVTNHEGIPDAILVRGIIPEQGIAHMHERRKVKNKKMLADGPGKLSQAMGIHYHYSGIKLGEESAGFKVWLEEGEQVVEQNILTDVRVGIDYAEEDVHRPWRYQLKKAHFSSK